MKIRLSGAGKRFSREWIFRNADLSFNAGTAYAITGANGSGKSTLLQCVAGMLEINEGSIEYSNQEGLINNEAAYRHISFCSPYLDVIEEMTLVEFLGFHSSFKSFIKGFDINNIIRAVALEASANKQIRYFSSGMKQRVKLAQAIFSDAGIILLDEPCSTLDLKGIELYHSLIEDHCKERLVLVCSNDEVEYRFCKEIISIHDFKPPVKTA